MCLQIVNIHLTGMLMDPHVCWHSRCGYVPDSPDSCGVTPFMDAVRSGHISVAKTLREKHQVKPMHTAVLGKVEAISDPSALHWRRLQQPPINSELSRCTKLLSLASRRCCGFWCRSWMLTWTREWKTPTLLLCIMPQRSDCQSKWTHWHEDTSSTVHWGDLLVKIHLGLLVCFQEGHTSTVKTLLELGAGLHCRDRKGRSGNQTQQQHFRDKHLNTYVPSEDRSLWMASDFVLFHTFVLFGGVFVRLSHICPLFPSCSPSHGLHRATRTDGRGAAGAGTRRLKRLWRHHSTASCPKTRCCASVWRVPKIKVQNVFVHRVRGPIPLWVSVFPNPVVNRVCRQFF